MKSAILGLYFFLQASSILAAESTITVNPGDTGSIELDLTNDPTSDGSLENVRLMMLAPSGISASPSPTKSIDPGITEKLTLDYSIDPEAIDGEILAVFRATTTTEVEPDLSEFDATLVFKVVRPPAISFVDDGGFGLLNSNGAPGHAGDTFPTGNISIHAYSVHGIERISLAGPTPYAPANYTVDFATAIKQFSGLYNGTYTVTARDYAGVESSAAFGVNLDLTPPILGVREISSIGTVVGVGAFSSATLHISATDYYPEGTARLESIEVYAVEPEFGLVGVVDVVNASSVSFSTTLPKGEYWVAAWDSVDNVAFRSFTISTSVAPSVSLSMTGTGTYPYSDFYGISRATATVVLSYATSFASGVPSSTGTLSFTARNNASTSTMPGSPIAYVEVTGPSPYSYSHTYSPPEDSVGTTDLPFMVPGSYSMKVRDTGNRETIMPFRLVELIGYKCPDITSSFVSTTVFTSSNGLCVKSTLGASSIQKTSVTGGAMGTEESLTSISGGKYRYSGTLTASSSVGMQYFLARDAESNSVRIISDLAIAESSLSGGGSDSVSDDVDLDDFDFVPGANAWAPKGATSMITYSTISATGKSISNSVQTIGHLTWTLNGSPILDGDITLSTSGVYDIPAFTSDTYIPISGHTPHFEATLTNKTRTDVFPSECGGQTTGTCPPGFEATVADSIFTAGVSIVGMRALRIDSSDNLAIAVSSGPSLTMNLANNVTLELPAHSTGTIVLTRTRREPPLRYRDAGQNTTYRFYAAGMDLTGPVYVTLPTSTGTLTAEQRSGITMLQAANRPNPQPEEFRPITSSATVGFVRGASDDFNAYNGVELMVVTSVHETPSSVSNSNLAFQSNNSSVTITSVNPNAPEVRRFLAVLRSQGLMPVTSITKLGPDGATFSNPGVVQMGVSDASLSGMGVTRESLKLIQFSALGQGRPMPSQRDGRDYIVARVPYFTSNFAVFGSTTAVYEDLLAPETRTLFTGTASTDAAGRIYVDSRTAIGFTAYDPTSAYFSSSGSSATYILLDTPFVSTTSTPGSVYSSTFSLSTGTHRLSYYTVDNAGNYEPVTVSSVIVNSLDNAAPRTSLDWATGAYVSSMSVLHVSSTAPLGFSVSDDLYLTYDSLGIGATQMFYAIDSTTTFSRFSSSFTLGTQGTHTLAFYSIDREGNVESFSTKTVSVDATAPVSTPSLSGAFLTFEAMDPVAGGVASGVQRIRYLVGVSTPSACNGVSEDTSAARGTCANPWYDGHHHLTNGSRLIHYQAVDNTGNMEALRAITYNVYAQSYLGGVALAAASNSLWTVTSLDESLALAKTATNGTLVSSAALTDAAADGLPWSVFVDTAGRVYAIGSRGSEDEGLQVGVYRASTSGSSIDREFSFDSGFEKNEYVLASAGGWIAGAVQTDGDEEGGSLAMGLWKFTPGSGVIALSTYNARTGMDLGGALAVDPDGTVWISGFTLNSGTEKLDLALWHYSGDGHTLLGGPYLQPSYLEGLDGVTSFGSVVASTYSVYVAAPRWNGASGLNTAFLRFDKSSAQFATNSTWKAADDETSYPSTLLQTPDGLTVVGGLGGDYSTAMIWRYGLSGGLQSATYTDAGGARAGALNDSRIWLSVDGATAPYRVDNEYAADGEESDVLPPSTYLYAEYPSLDSGTTVYVSSFTNIYLYAADNRVVTGDGLGVGATQTFYAKDAGSYSLYSGSFSFVSAGTHTVRAYSLDLLGQAESVSTRTVLVGSDLQAPRTSLTTGQRAYIPASTIYASSITPFGLSSEDDRFVAYDFLGASTATYYAVDSTTTFSAFSGTFTIVSEGTHTLAYFTIDTAGNAESVSTRAVSVDRTAPVTTPVLSGQFVVLTATDPVTNGVASGVQRIRYLVDLSTPTSCAGVAEDTGAVRGSCANPWYGGHHYLPSGSHYVYYQAIDNTGSTETLKGRIYNVDPQPYLGGVGIGAGGGGDIWSVASLAEVLGMANTGSSGVLIASATLDGAVTDLPWSVFVDTSGRVYAIGAGGSEEQGLQVAVYRASEDGSSIDLAAGFDSGHDLNDYPFAAGRGGWITGGAQINGDEEGGDVALALWRFTPGSGSVSLSTAYSRTGFDVGAGVSEDPDGSVWIVGYSFNSGNDTFDLGLWHYDDDGHTLLGGPYYKESYIDNLDLISAAVYATTGSVYVASARTNGASGLDSAFLRFDKGAAAFNTETVWRATGTDSSYPVAIVPDGDGFLVAGGLGGDYTTAMLWRYGANGGLRSASFTDAGGARGAMIMSGTIWLAVDGSTSPYRVEAEYSAEGSVLGVLPPTLTSLSPASGPIGSLITLSGSSFGPYYSTASFVRVGGSTAPLGGWGTNSIVARVPALSSGTAAVYVQLETVNGPQISATSYFTVSVPTITAISPSSAPIGAPFLMTGQGFGVYSSTLAFVRIGASTASLTSWSDTSIAGTIPGALSTGSVSISVERWMSGSVSSSTASFLVLLPTISTINPNPAAPEAVVTVTGEGFGPYDGDNTQLLVDGSSVAVSVWADRAIVWALPSDAADGTYPVVVRRMVQSYTVNSASIPFVVDTMFGGLSFGFRQAQPLAAKPDLHFLGSLRISHDKGGRVQAAAKAAVQVPAGALPADTEITLKRMPSDRGRTDAADQIKAKPAGEPIEFGPEGSHFDSPVTIELPYDPTLVGDDGRGVAVHYFNALRRIWEPLASTVDKIRKVVIAQTDHFSIYQPLGISPSTAAQDEFYYRDHYAYPNPSRNGALVYFRIQPGLAQTVEVRVYDVAGRKVHESSDFTFLGPIDDGNGKGAQNTYDHWWDVRGSGSGVYTFVIKASQAGQKPIVKSGKVAVIR